ncbi:nuclear transport factor 2 family protein [Oceanicola sp. 22II-s10i]|uniref:nuclear transport factor 2 family protein n=1 Tax=Oceanicola sp. 22II-s10i TaxID=1317116 RepID=UPI000B52883A|nr:nuclear transport factor 2 family protein [Oceanicola sp. 22II-s10i]
MPQQSDIWQIEELLWTGGTDAFRRRMADGCLMAFPGIGTLQGEQILESLKEAPRWQSVEMEGRHVSETDGLTVLSYRARAVREGDPVCEALCTSTWIWRDGGWLLVQHQQSPVHSEAIA